MLGVGRKGLRGVRGQRGGSAGGSDPGMLVVEPPEAPILVRGHVSDTTPKPIMGAKRGSHPWSIPLLL